MANTNLAGLQANIATDLTRTDLTSQIASAVNDAIQHYSDARFWFNVTRSLTFQTTPNQQQYTAADMAQIPHIIRIEKLWIILPNTTSISGIYPLKWLEPDEFEWLTQDVNPGTPTVYTYVDESILMYPIPIAAYTMRPLMHYRLAPLVNPTDTNGWTQYAEQLIRCHAKLILYTNVLGDAAGASAMQGEIQAFKDRLDYETSARMATGRIRATEF